MSQDPVRDVITGQNAKIRACYTRRLKAVPGLAGKVVVRFEIQADGTPNKIEITSSTVNDSVLERCLVARIKSLRFAARAGGGVLEVSHPFLFTP